MSSPAWDPQRWKRVTRLFNQTLDMAAQERDAFLDQVEREDPEIGAALRKMLAADAAFTTDTPPSAAAAIGDALDPELPPGTLLGAYAIESCLGMGGMGRVYRAQRVEGGVAQTVAIKCLRFRSRDAEFTRRFLRERKILAGLSHPHIARFLDAGADADGQPFVVMEYVDGTPITEFASTRKLPLRDRIELLLKVMGAVAYSHQQLIVHRDIKPGNVLVTAEGEPRLLDFGIAKQLAPLALPQASSTETALEQRAFSPTHASPEQWKATAISTASDVYALGVLAYELLSGQPPLALAGLAYADARQTVLESLPLPPSQRIGDPAPDGTSAVIWKRALRGDLDNIVLHALKKEPHERYATVDAFMADLRRWLEQEPISLRSGHRRYRLQKFVQRNTAAVVAGALAVLAVVAGGAAFAWQAHQANQRAVELEQVVQFQSTMLKQIDPTKAGLLLSDDVFAKFGNALEKKGIAQPERALQQAAFGGFWNQVNTTDVARDLIDHTILRPAVLAIDKQFSAQPVVMASLNHALADRYESIGLYDAAVPLQERALALRRHHLGDDHPDTLDSLSQLGKIRLVQNQYALAEPILLETLEATRRVLGEDNLETLIAINNMGTLRLYQGRLDQAETYAREAFGRQQKRFGPDHPNTSLFANNLANIVQAQGKLAEAESLHRDAFAARRRILGEDDPQTLSSLNNIGALLHAQNRWAEAEPFVRESMEKRRRVLGEEHPDTLTTVFNLAEVLRMQGKRADAEPYVRAALKGLQRVRGEDHPSTIAALNLLGILLRDQGQLEAAEPYMRDAMQRRIRTLGADHLETLAATSNMAMLLQVQGKFDQAEPLLAHVLEQRRRQLGSTHPLVLRSLNGIAVSRLGQGRFAEVIRLLVPAEAAMRDAFANQDAEHLCKCLTHVGRAHTGLHEFAAAQTSLLEAHQICLPATTTTPKEKRESVQAAVELYTAWNRAMPSSGHAETAHRFSQMLATLQLQQPP